MIRTPGFLAFRDEAYIAENGEGYKGAGNAECGIWIADFPFAVPWCPV